MVVVEFLEIFYEEYERGEVENVWSPFESFFEIVFVAELEKVGQVGYICEVDIWEQFIFVLRPQNSSQVDFPVMKYVFQNSFIMLTECFIERISGEFTIINNLKIRISKQIKFIQNLQYIFFLLPTAEKLGQLLKIPLNFLINRDKIALKSFLELFDLFFYRPGTFGVTEGAFVQLCAEN